MFNELELNRPAIKGKKVSNL